MKLLSLDTQGTKQDLVERVHAYLSTKQVGNVHTADLMPIGLSVCSLACNLYVFPIKICIRCPA